MSPGAFDLKRRARPSATAVADLIKSLTAKTTPPVAAGGSGWWRRDIRLQFQPVFRTVDAPEPRPAWRHDTAQTAPILICGATGTLGRALARACEWRGLDYVLADRAVLDLSDQGSIARALDRHQPWAVINAAGWVRVDEAETREADCHDANAAGCARLAQACAANGVRFAGFSSDLVFDGQKGAAYVESDAPAPLNAYGRSKHAAEDAVLEAGGLMARTAAFFSPYDLHNFATQVAHGLARGRSIAAAHDSVVSPTYVPDLVDAVLNLVIDGEVGLWHLANPGAVSWSEFAGHLAHALRLDARLIRPTASADMGWMAQRPRHAPLASERGALLPPLHDAIGRYAAMMIASEFEAEVRAPLGQPIMA